MWSRSKVLVFALALVASSSAFAGNPRAPVRRHEGVPDILRPGRTLRERTPFVTIRTLDGKLRFMLAHGEIAGGPMLLYPSSGRESGAPRAEIGGFLFDELRNVNRLDREGFRVDTFVVKQRLRWSHELSIGDINLRLDSGPETEPWRASLARIARPRKPAREWREQARKMLVNINMPQPAESDYQATALSSRIELTPGQIVIPGMEVPLEVSLLEGTRFRLWTSGFLHASASLTNDRGGPLESLRVGAELRPDQILVTREPDLIFELVQ